MNRCIKAGWVAGAVQHTAAYDCNMNVENRDTMFGCNYRG